MYMNSLSSPNSFKKLTSTLPMESLLLGDDVILDAQRWLWQSLKLAVEPAAALPLAALRTGAVSPAAGQRIGLVLCGANVDPATLV